MVHYLTHQIRSVAIRLEVVGFRESGQLRAGCRVYGVEFSIWVVRLKFRGSGLGDWFHELGFRFEVSGFGVWRLWSRVEGSIPLQRLHRINPVRSQCTHGSTTIARQSSETGSHDRSSPSRSQVDSPQHLGICATGSWSSL